MNPYRIQEADFAVPSAWGDQSLTLFKIPAGPGAKEASFVITRDPNQRDTEFSAYLASQIAVCQKQLSGFKLLKQQDLIVSGHRAAQLDYVWKNEGRELMLRQVFIERKPAILILTLTTTQADLPHHEAAWNDVLESVKVVTPTPSAPPPEPTAAVTPPPPAARWGKDDPALS